MGSARGNGSESDAPSALTSAIDNEGWADAEAEDNSKHHKRKKEKKKKKRDLESGDDGGSHEKSKERSNLNHSQSEPAVSMGVLGKNRAAAPPPEGHEARGMGGGPYPTVPHNFPESE